MNYKMIGKLLGMLFLLEGIFLIPAAGISLYDQEIIALQSLLVTIGILFAVGGALWFLCKNAEKRFYAREGFLIVAIAWVLMAIFGAMPFVLSGEIPHFIDAFFEVVSGLTTTGASILPRPEDISRGLLYWRSFTHWLGGMGILVFLLAVVSTDRGGGSALHLLRAESPGPMVGKLVPKIKQTAKILYTIYIVLTIACVLLLLAGGMSLFDAVCTAFGTAGTGGFGVHSDSMASYRPYLQSVTTVFMALFGINFSIYHMVLLRDFKGIFHDEEIRVYLGLLFGSTIIIALNIFPQFTSFGQAFHHSAFTVSSIMTTTGFATVDFNAWPQLSRSILVVLMVFGASAGSTGGGIKSARVLLLMKSLKKEIQKVLHPRTVKVVTMSGKPINDSVIHGVNIYMTAYCAISILSFILISLDNLSLETNLTAVIACMNNIGPGLDLVGPTGNYAAFSNFSKIILSIDMLLGRLEIFPILILFDPHTWNRKL